MPNKGRRGAELGLPNSQSVDGLDEVAKGLAAGTISRRRAIKLGAAALLGSMGLLSLSPHRAGAQVTAQGVCTGIPAISNKVCPPQQLTGRGRCGTCQSCFCTRTVSGTKRCLDFAGRGCPHTDQCDSNSDCPKNEVCAKVGGCCGNPGRNVCLPRCPSDPALCPGV